MTSSFSEIGVGVICPECGEQHYKDVGWFRGQNRLTCEACGREIRLQSERLRASVDGFDEKAENLSTRK